MMTPIWTTPPPSPIPLSSTEIHLWKLGSLDTELTDDPSLYLSDEELTRGRRLRFPLKQQRFFQGRTRLRQILARYLDRTPRDLTLAVSETGKPYLAGVEGLHFNLSHSGDQALLAIARTPLGVDLEQLKSRDVSSLAERFFSQSEADTVRNGSTPLESFYRIWTGKEAVLKAIGTGLTYPLNRFSIPTDSLSPLIIDHQTWYLSWLVPEPDYLGAVCLSAPSAKFFFRWYTFK